MPRKSIASRAHALREMTKFSLISGEPLEVSTRAVNQQLGVGNYGRRCILITDASTRQCLTVVRALGKADFDITVGDHKYNALSFFSKFVRNRLIYPNPLRYPKRFVKSILKIAHKYDAIVPILEPSMLALTRSREMLTNLTELIAPDYLSLQVAMSKYRTYSEALRHHVPCPLTYLITNFRELKEAAQDIGYPIILKTDKESGLDPESRYKIARSPQELLHAFQYLRRRTQMPLLVQKFIAGEKVGAFYLFNKYGELITTFCHRRIIEAPGGLSVLCESFFNLRALKYGYRLLKALSWKGVAMAEFIINKEDRAPYLLEINPRFWGSLPLAIVAGVNFPRLLIECWTERRGHDVPLTRHYKYARCLILLPMQRFFRDGGVRAIMDVLKEILKNLAPKPAIFELMEKDVMPFIMAIRRVDRD